MAAEASHREIERKFVVRKLPANLEQFPHRLVEQGYLATGPGGLQVRLRKSGDKLSLTYKRDDSGGRIEREVELTPEQFNVLWPASEGRRLTKTRYDVPHGDRLVEVDIYRGRHEGLVVAEVEFADENSARAFQPPDWLGADVSGKPRYSNVRLASE